MFNNIHGGYARGYRGDSFLFVKTPEDQTYQYSGELNEPFQPSRKQDALNTSKPLPRDYSRPPLDGFSRKQINADSVTARQLMTQTFIDGVHTGSRITENTIYESNPQHHTQDILQELEEKRQDLQNDLDDAEMKGDDTDRLKSFVDQIDKEIDSIHRAVNPNYQVENSLAQLLELVKNGGGSALAPAPAVVPAPAPRAPAVPAVGAVDGFRVVIETEFKNQEVSVEALNYNNFDPFESWFDRSVGRITKGNADEVIKNIQVFKKALKEDLSEEKNKILDARVIRVLAQNFIDNKIKKRQVWKLFSPKRKDEINDEIDRLRKL